MNLRQQLESQLESVVFVDPSNPPASSLGMTIERHEVTVIANPRKNETIAVQDPFITRDRELLESIFEDDRPSLVEIKRQAHEPSEHVLTLKRMAQRIQKQSIDDAWKFAPSWQAPVESAASMGAIEGLTALQVPLIREEWLIDQYTPYDAEDAFESQNSFSSRMRLPLVKMISLTPVIIPEPLAPEMIEEEVIVHHSRFARLRERLSDVFSGLKGRAREVATDIHLAEADLITEAEEAWDVPVVVPRISYIRVVGSFMVFALLLSLPAGAVSLARSVRSSWTSIESQGRSTLARAELALATSPEKASEQWQATAQGFADSDQALNDVNVLAVALSKILPQTRNAYASARALLDAGEQASQAAALFSKGADAALSGESRFSTDRLNVFTTYLDQVEERIAKANEAMSQVDESVIPNEQRSRVTDLKSRLLQASKALQEVRQFSQIMPSILGEDHHRRYLVVFQNSSELRPTGGFMGSMAEVVVDRGELRQVHVMGGGPYDLQGQLKTRVKAPEPISLISARWEFQDANWYPDFAASAENIRRFWSDSGQPTLDGVIAVNVEVMEGLLEDIGPIEMPEYGKVFTAESFRQELQSAVEVEYDKTENKPKKIIGDLFPLVMERVLEADNELKPKLLKRLTASLTNKDVQIYMVREKEQSVFSRYGWTGELKPVIGDTMAVIGTNIAGQKSDAAIREKVHHDIRISNDGSITDTVTLVREHTADKGAIFTGVNNVQFVRFYAPEGSVLMGANGFKAPSSTLFEQPLPQDGTDALLASIEKKQRITSEGLVATDEFGRTSFGGWIQLKPGETATTTVSYKLPVNAFELAKRWYPSASESHRAAYVLNSTSQSGSRRTLTQSITVPEGWTQLWSNADLASSNKWNTDQLNAILFETP